MYLYIDDYKNVVQWYLTCTVSVSVIERLLFQEELLFFNITSQLASIVRAVSRISFGGGLPPGKFFQK